MEFDEPRCISGDAPRLALTLTEPESGEIAGIARAQVMKIIACNLAQVA
ncbi:MAG: hypothetical protein AAFR04_05380 [Pseudomonadota bacterium]